MPATSNRPEEYPHEFICKDTGIVLRYRKCPFTVTAQLHTEYEKQFPAPKPPTQKIDYGDNEKIDEPNPSHPTYQRLLAEWNAAKVTWVNEKAMRVFADYAIQCEVDKSAVTQLRESMKAQGVALDPGDKFVYIWNIAVGTGDGYGELFAAIQRRSQVTEQAVSETLGRFPNTISTA